ncbi:PREDICTED: eukaryotic translation initiation factor 4 gamma 2-like [Amphimedon queenslandica]|uniref:Eukaryotic translation initiation factor 4 gamma 2 n=1 Tax=Amphimedon queenslandica TaxID=400682 RepID=A0AAN0JA32_AMPQE|nr:PREDICTED: eukaryotic translation initiation factor 4 gamma 2-like [Amphimedon queenslandica]|eukprot:XP_019853586.1 PREDICTED: eukaryotic translation initiation factor 4 gamma 2-like [Amphimedon queenslandica]
MLHERIVHQCIQELLERRRSLDGMCDNIECVCSLLVTVGNRLDTSKASGWVDQYFKRMEDLMSSNDFPSRIKFMIMNTVDLRRNQWVPRNTKVLEVPKPLDRGPVLVEYSPRVSQNNHKTSAPLIKNPGPPIRGFGQNKGFMQLPRAASKSPGPPHKSLSPGPPLKTTGPLVKEGTSTKDVNLKKLPTRKVTSSESVSLRPSSASRKFQQQRLHPPAPKDEATPISIIPRTRDDSSDDEATPSCHDYHVVSVKGSQTEGKELLKPNTKIQAGPELSNSEIVLIPILTQYLSHKRVPDAVQLLMTSHIDLDEITHTLINGTLNKSEDDRTLVSLLFNELHKEGDLSSLIFMKGIEKVLSNRVKFESVINRNSISGYISRAIVRGVVTLSIAMATFKDGAHSPIGLIVVQSLVNLIGQDSLKKLFKDNGMLITEILAPVDKPYQSATKVLEKKNLGFLYPLKQLQVQLKSLLKEPLTTHLTLYKWIKANVDPLFYKNTDFIVLLTKCILSHVIKATSEAPSKDDLDKETFKMEDYKLVLQKFVSEEPVLQLGVLYATQVYCNDVNFPKGLLLRLFSYWYNMDVVEEEVLMKWREDVNEDYPGKGKALFQVNHWLVLLAEAEVESD